MEGGRCARPDRRPAHVGALPHAETVFPFVPEADRTEAMEGLAQAYIATREADIGAAFAHERDGLSDGYGLYLLPCARQLTAESPRRLAGLCAAGRMVYATYPLELMAARTCGVNPEPTWAIYDALASLAGLWQPVRVHDPRVLVDSLVHEPGRHYVFLVSGCEEELTVEADVFAGEAHGRGHLVDLGGGPVGAVTAGTYDVVVLELVGGIGGPAGE
ncbi:MAG: hypothetical protein ACYDH5_00285 [Acidimicrobiales bacterium]